MKIINSKIFGELHCRVLNVKVLRRGDIITTYELDQGCLICYQILPYGSVSQHIILYPTQFIEACGIERGHLDQLIIDSNNGNTRNREIVVAMPASVSQRILCDIASPFTKPRWVKGRTMIGGHSNE